MNRAARARRAGRQLVAAAWRIETATGATWGHYAVSYTAAAAADIDRTARRAGHRTRILDRRGERVHVTHDASGACHLVTIPD